jgi:hypothetical protein
MDNAGKTHPVERRRYPRYDTEMEVYFEINYDTKIRVEFEVLGERDNKLGDVAPKYFGLCKNISAEGLLIVSKKQLAKDDNLIIYVYEPMVTKPVVMEGCVRWCNKSPEIDKSGEMFHAGVQIKSVNSVSVPDSIYLDKKYKVMWSVLLESVFGNFAAIRKPPISRKKLRA